MVQTRYLERHQPDIARELQDLIETIGGSIPALAALLTNERRVAGNPLP